jgi:hypothetical protein
MALMVEVLRTIIGPAYGVDELVEVDPFVV